MGSSLNLRIIEQPFFEECIWKTLHHTTFLHCALEQGTWAPSARGRLQFGWPCASSRPQSVCAFVCVSARDLPKENISCILLLWSVIIVLCFIFLSSVCSVHVQQECFSLLINQQCAAVCYCQQVLNDDYVIRISSLRAWSVAHQRIHT